MQKFPPVYYLIADLDDFIQKMYSNLEGIGQLSSWIEVIFAKGKSLNVFFLGAANIQQTAGLGSRQAYQSFIRDRKGILLGSSLQGKQLRVGQAYAVSASDPQEVERIVIPQNRGIVLP